MDYIDTNECVADGLHLTDCDNNGCCNFCGEQPEESDCPEYLADGSCIHSDCATRYGF